MVLPVKHYSCCHCAVSHQAPFIYTFMQVLANTDLCAESWEVGYVKERNKHMCMHRAATYLQFIQENFKPCRPETD